MTKPRKERKPNYVTLDDGTVLDDTTVDRIVREVDEAVLAGKGKTTVFGRGRPSLSGLPAQPPAES